MTTATTVSLPVVDAGKFFAARLRGDDAKAEAAALGAAIKEACHSVGMFYLTGHNIDRDLINKVMSESALFFASDETEKNAINIKNSAQFRGYGLLKNYRDWREQIHLGVEAPLPVSVSEMEDAPAFWRMWGPNQWPLTRTNEFKETMLAYFDAVETLSRVILTLVAESLDYPGDFFTARMKDRPYLLMKSMSYLPQQQLSVRRTASPVGVPTGIVGGTGDGGTAGAQMGVTAHCDWSWLTFLIQDNVGGLEAQDLSGQWHKVDPLPHSIVINTGELLELETGGYLRASPHRVINASITRQRFSVPLFINPALDSIITPSGSFASTEPHHGDTEPRPGAHVHKVVKPGTELAPFVFGESEWLRKAQGLWCYDQACVDGLTVSDAARAI